MLNRPGSPAPVQLRSISAAFPVLVATVALTVAGLVLLSVVGFEIQGAARAYVNGEGEWSKAQRDAVSCLLRYAGSADASDFACYDVAIQINLHDRTARLELEKPNADFEVARLGFLGGRNHPDDVGRLIWLFRMFRREPHMRTAIDVWARADEEIGALETVAGEIQSAHDLGAAATDIAPLTSRVYAINARLTPLEREFSATLGAASRLIHQWLVAGIIGIGLVLISIGGAVVYRLLTHLGRSQLALFESQRELAAILESALDAVITMDQDCRIDAFNAAAEQMFQVRRDAAIGQEMITVIAGRDRWDAHRRGLDHYLATGDGDAIDRRLELEAARADGTRFPIELSITRVPGSMPARYTAFLRDLTQRREAEERLAQAQKLETVGRLAGGVAHDFNNVLTVILGFSDLLRERLESDDAGMFELEQIETAAERARSLTSQLLSFSRKQMLRLEPLNLNDLVVESSSLIERLIGEQVRVQLLLDPREGIVRGDRGQLQQVLLNLAVNARDAMPGGGALTIATQAEPGEMVRVMVSDTGCGMAPEVQARVFEPFFTTKEQGRGTGLGLATVYGTVSQLGGTIAVDSIVDVGTRFVIELPGTSDRPARAVVERMRRDDGCGRILVVEDEGAVRELVSRALTRRGYDVRVAANAEEALDLLADRSVHLDLLLSDVVMPGMTGHALALKLRAERPDLKVILMSGYSEEQVRSQAARRDGLVLLRKPFAMTTLEDAITGMLGADATPLAS